MPKKEKYSAAKNSEQNEDSSKKAAGVVTKGAIDYATGGAGGKYYDKLKKMPIVGNKLDKKEEKVGKRLNMLSGGKFGKMAKKADDAGALDAADKALSVGGSPNGNEDIGNQKEGNSLSNDSSLGKKGGLPPLGNFGKNGGKSLFGRDNSEDNDNNENTGSEKDTDLIGSISGSAFLKSPKVKLIIIGCCIFFFLFLGIIISASHETDEEEEDDIQTQEISCATNSKILSIALGEVGNNEANGTHTKYLSYLGFAPSTAWCAAFVSWCANQAGIEEVVIPHTASVSTFLSYFQRADVFHSISSNYKPIPGDLIIWKALGRSHIGIVSEYDSSNGVLTTVEGNSSDAVRINKYQFSNLQSQGVVGFASPKYGEGNCTTCQNIQSTSKSEVLLPLSVRNKSNVMTFMGWFKITSTSSTQYKLRESAGESYNSEGFAIICNRYVIATTSTYGKVGDYLDFYLENGKIISTIKGDEKSSNDRNYSRYGHLYHGKVNPVEFVVNDKWYDASKKHGNHPNPGTNGCHPEWNSNVIKVVNHGNYWG